MRITMIAALATAAMGANPVLAAPAPTQSRSTMPFAQAQRAEPLAAYAQYRGRYYGGPRYGGRGYYGRPYYGGRYYGHGYGYGGAAAAGIAGLATGAIIGGALAAQAQPAPTYVVPDGGGDAYCAQRYRSYDPGSGTFLGYDGLRHPCP